MNIKYKKDEQNEDNSDQRNKTKRETLSGKRQSESPCNPQSDSSLNQTMLEVLMFEEGSMMKNLQLNNEAINVSDQVDKKINHEQILYQTLKEKQKVNSKMNMMMALQNIKNQGTLENQSEIKEQSDLEVIDEKILKDFENQETPNQDY